MFNSFSLDIGRRFTALRPIVAMAAVAAAFFSVSTPAQAQSQAASGSPELRALFASWAQEDRQRQGVMAIPSASPISSYRMTSSFGTRNDPFGRGRRRHNGLDMASPRGTPIYATADGIVGRAQWVSGYGKYVEINHGGDIQTRYGHMSQILVQPGARVTRGQMIGHVGSTGRSTGNHLHYEVRIDGIPVNPMPFLTSTAYLASLPSNSTTTGEGTVAVGASQ